MKNKIKIRKAKTEDIDLIIDIQKRDEFDHSYYITRQRLNGLFARGEIFFIAFCKDKAVGFASVYIEIRARLHFLSVAKEYMGRGIGSLLMQKIINEVKKKRKKMIYVYTETRSPIEQFFIKNGFKKAGYFKDRFGKGKDANIFILYL